MLSLSTAVALCRIARSACLQLLTERLHGDGVFLYHLHAHCTRLNSSFQCASCFFPLCLSPSHRFISHTFIVTLTIELYRGKIFWSTSTDCCGAVFSMLQCVFGDGVPFTIHLPTPTTCTCIEKTL